MCYKHFSSPFFGVMGRGGELHSRFGLDTSSWLADWSVRPQGLKRELAFISALRSTSILPRRMAEVIWWKIEPNAEFTAKEPPKCFHFAHFQRHFREREGGEGEGRRPIFPPPHAPILPFKRGTPPKTDPTRCLSRPTEIDLSLRLSLGVTVKASVFQTQRLWLHKIG